LNDHPRIKWFVLLLTALTGTFAIAAPFMSMSVLFNEISTDLHLNLVQVGLTWSIGSLPAVFVGLLSGAINDRFGPKRVIMIASILIGLSGAIRGLSGDFPSLLAAVILFGMLSPVISTSAFKICRLWFPNRQLALANGVFSMGMALGFFLSSLFSANVLSNWLGGWRPVMFFYGILAVLLFIPWYFAPAAPRTAGIGVTTMATVPMRQAISHVIKLKNVWLLGITLMAMSGCMQGVTGYIPLYLRGLGWPALHADGAQSLFHLLSMSFVLPIAIWSDRLKARKALLFSLMVVIVVGGGLLAVAQGPLIWGAIALMGLVRDASMALIMTMVIEVEGVGPTYAGSASGFAILFLSLGSLLAPPLGNSLAEFAPNLPFAFWAGLTAVGLVSLWFVKISRKQAHGITY
jgi:cyanate permease